MDALDIFLASIKAKSLHLGRFLGLLHLLVAYKITDEADQPVSQGLTFRELSERFKKARWNPEDIETLGLNAKDLPQRDRLRFWYVVLVRSGVTSSKAAVEAETLAKAIRKIGYKAIPPVKA